jgi:hypothetical protein
MRPTENRTKIIVLYFKHQKIINFLFIMFFGFHIYEDIKNDLLFEIRVKEILAANMVYPCAMYVSNALFEIQ